MKIPMAEATGDTRGGLASVVGIIRPAMMHVWHIDVGGAHTFPVWKNDLYHFATLLFG